MKQKMEQETNVQSIKAAQMRILLSNNSTSKLSLYSLVIWAMRANEVSAANACFLLQFCSCYLFFCYYHAVSTHSCLLLGHRVVRAVSGVCMILFPVLYSQQQDCMHVSPYVLVFLFAGEVSGCVCACAAQLLVAFECLVDTLYVRLQGV